MSKFDKYTLIELTKLGNDISNEHENVKKEILNLTYEIETTEKKINDLISRLNVLEQIYKDIVNEIDNRNGL